MIEPGKPEKLTGVELVEALELGAARIRMAAAGDLRHVGDALAALALEAARRLASLSPDNIDLEWSKLRRRIKTLEDAAPAESLAGKCRNVVIHGDGRLTCELEIADGAAGARFLEQITSGRL